MLQTTKYPLFPDPIKSTRSISSEQGQASSAQGTGAYDILW